MKSLHAHLILLAACMLLVDGEQAVLCAISTLRNLKDNCEVSVFVLQQCEADNHNRYAAACIAYSAGTLNEDQM